MRTATNWLLCETALASDGGVVVIEDAGTANVSDTYVHAEIAPAPEAVHRALWVHTMNVHECDVVGRRVYVRVLSGSDAGGLGVLAFDGHLNIASGIVATGELRNPDRQLLVGPPGVIRVSVFVAHDIDAVYFDDSGVSYPHQGPVRSPCCCTVCPGTPAPSTARGGAASRGGVAAEVSRQACRPL